MEEKQTKKMNIGLKLSRNFQTVTCEILDEPVSYENEEELKAKIRRIFGILKDEVDLEFSKIQEKK